MYNDQDINFSIPLPRSNYRDGPEGSSFDVPSKTSIFRLHLQAYRLERAAAVGLDQVTQVP